MADSDNVVDFERGGERFRHARMHREKEARVEDMKERFEAALPTRKTPVKDYFRKKKSRKKT